MSVRRGYIHDGHFTFSVALRDLGKELARSMPRAPRFADLDVRDTADQLLQRHYRLVQHLTQRPLREVQTDPRIAVKVRAALLTALTGPLLGSQRAQSIARMQATDGPCITCGEARCGSNRIRVLGPPGTPAGGRVHVLISHHKNELAGRTRAPIEYTVEDPYLAELVRRYVSAARTLLHEPFLPELDNPWGAGGPSGRRPMPRTPLTTGRAGVVRRVDRPIEAPVGRERDDYDEEEEEEDDEELMIVPDPMPVRRDKGVVAGGGAGRGGEQFINARTAQHAFMQRISAGVKKSGPSKNPADYLFLTLRPINQFGEIVYVQGRGNQVLAGDTNAMSKAVTDAARIALGEDKFGWVYDHPMIYSYVIYSARATPLRKQGVE